jgi:uncharacterized protein with FMN-binding domain
MKPRNNNKKMLAIIGLVVIVAVIAVTGWATRDASDSAATPSDSVATGTPDSDTATVANQTYKDGTYNADGSYTSPGGREAIKVSLTLKGDKVTASTVESDAGDPTGQEYQEQFIAGYKSQVVGRSLDDIELSRVSGSSLTSQGFNAAVEQIKAQAAS